MLTSGTNPQFTFDVHQSVVPGYPLSTANRANLDLPNADCNRQASDEVIVGFTGTIALGI